MPHIIINARDILSDPESSLKDLFDLASAAADDVRKIEAELQEYPCPYLI
jgi:hypothetical protein